MAHLELRQVNWAKLNEMNKSHQYSIVHLICFHFEKSHSEMNE